MVDIDENLNVKPKIKLIKIIPEQYWGYINVFDEIETNQLPQIRKKNHEIELLEKKTPRQSPEARYTICQKMNFWY